MASDHAIYELRERLAELSKRVSDLCEHIKDTRNYSHDLDQRILRLENITTLNDNGHVRLTDPYERPPELDGGCWGGTD